MTRMLNCLCFNTCLHHQDTTGLFYVILKANKGTTKNQYYKGVWLVGSVCVVCGCLSVSGIFWKVVIPLGWILSTFVLHQILPLYKSCVGIMTNKAVNNLKNLDVLQTSWFLSQPMHHPVRMSEKKSWWSR